MRPKSRKGCQVNTRSSTPKSSRNETRSEAPQAGHGLAPEVGPGAGSAAAGAAGRPDRTRLNRQTHGVVSFSLVRGERIIYDNQNSLKAHLGIGSRASLEDSNSLHLRPSLRKLRDPGPLPKSLSWCPEMPQPPGELQPLRYAATISRVRTRSSWWVVGGGGTGWKHPTHQATPAAHTVTACQVGLRYYTIMLIAC